GFPQANTNTASAVTNHHQGTEAKASSTLDDLRDTIDMNNFINIFCLFSKFLSHPRSLSSARTYTLRLELQPFFACPKRNRFNTPVIEKAVAIKNYLLYPMLQRFFCDHLSDKCCPCDIAPTLTSRPKILA